MIEILPIQEDVLTSTVRDLDNKGLYITSLDLITKLLTCKLPHKNREKSIKMILEFLAHADNVMESNYGETQVTFHRDHLDKFFGHVYRTKYLELLKDLKVMSKVSKSDGTWYTPGKESLSYRFFTQYIFSETALVIIDDEKQQISVETRVTKKYSDAIKLSTVDYAKAINAEISFCKANCTEEEYSIRLRQRLSRLFTSHNNRFIRKGTNSGRIYHSFSNITRVSREFLSVNNLHYHDIDITNCQPILLCYHLKSNDLEYDQNYIDDCQNGCIYERFIGLQGTFNIFDKGTYKKIERVLDRDSVKQELYKSVYFKFVIKNPINQAFKELYPKTHATLEKIAQEASIACVLQNIESSIFNDLRPKHSKFYFTLFDAVYFTDESDREHFLAQLHEKFNKLNINPKIK